MKGFRKEMREDGKEQRQVMRDAGKERRKEMRKEGSERAREIREIGKGKRPCGKNLRPRSGDGPREGFHGAPHDGGHFPERPDFPHRGTNQRKLGWEMPKS